jgi:preprotein translocase subunit SecE
MSDVITLIAKWLHNTVFPHRPANDPMLQGIAVVLTLVAFTVILILLADWLGTFFPLRY